MQGPCGMWPINTGAYVSLMTTRGGSLRRASRKITRGEPHSFSERKVTREHVLMRNGVVGHRLPPLRAATQQIRRSDLEALAHTVGSKDQPKVRSGTMHAHKGRRIVFSRNSEKPLMMPWCS
jgi:hypothetical protein